MKGTESLAAYAWQMIGCLGQIITRAAHLPWPCKHPFTHLTFWPVAFLWLLWTEQLPLPLVVWLIQLRVDLAVMSSEGSRECVLPECNGSFISQGNCYDLQCIIPTTASSCSSSGSGSMLAIVSIGFWWDGAHELNRNFTHTSLGLFLSTVGLNILSCHHRNSFPHDYQPWWLSIDYHSWSPPRWYLGQYQ